MKKKSKKYLIPLLTDQILEASSIYVEDNIAQVEFIRGETRYSLTVNIERRECGEMMQIVDMTSDESMEAFADDVLGFFINLELLADDLASDLESGRIEEY